MALKLIKSNERWVSFLGECSHLLYKTQMLESLIFFSILVRFWWGFRGRPLNTSMNPNIISATTFRSLCDSTIKALVLVYLADPGISLTLFVQETGTRPNSHKLRFYRLPMARTRHPQWNNLGAVHKVQCCPTLNFMNGPLCNSLDWWPKKRYPWPCP